MQIRVSGSSPAGKPAPPHSSDLKSHQIMVLISGIWPPAVTSSSLSPSRRLGKHYTHPTPKATRPKEARTRPETLELPRVSGTARRSTEPPGVRMSFMDRVTIRASQPGPAGIGPAHRESSPRSTARPGCGHAAGRHLASADTASTNHSSAKRPGTCCGEVPHRSTSGQRPGQPRHRHPGPPPGRPPDVRDEGPPGRVRRAAGAAAGTAAGCWRPGRR
jgi:hypothetical protein